MKKRYIKKYVSLALALTLMLSCLAGVEPLKAHAAGYELLKDKTYELVLVGGTTDTYTYVMPKTGYFYVEVTPTYFTDDEGEVVNSDAWLMPFRIIANYKQYEKANCYKSDGTYTSGMYAFAAGTEVKLEFESDTSGYLWHYNVSIYQVKETRFEKETNNSKTRANSLTAGKYHTGLMMEDDVDWFVFKAPSTGKYKVYVVNTDTNTGRSSMSSTIYNGSSKILANSYIYSGEGIIKCCTVNLKKGRKLYIKNADPSGNFVYKVKVKKA